MLPDIWVALYAYLTWEDAFALRLASTALLRAWDLCPKSIEKASPRRSFVCVKQCMVCNRYGDHMITMTVPWAILPPKAVVVCCNRLSCKYPVYWSFQQESIPFAHVIRPVLPDKVTIRRSSGKKQLAHCKASFVAKPDGTDEWHMLVWWLEGDMLYSKYVPYASLEEQAKERCGWRAMYEFTIEGVL